jgi:chromosome segregation ATPase
MFLPGSANRRIYSAKEKNHVEAKSTPKGSEHEKSGNNIIEARLERPFPNFGSGDANSYANQLIDLLQKKNRNLSIFLALGLLTAVTVAFLAFKFYYDSQILSSDLLDKSNHLETTVTQRDQLATQLAEKATATELQTKALKQALLITPAGENEDTRSIISRVEAATDISALTIEAQKLLTYTAGRIAALEQDKSDMADSLAKLNNEKQNLKTAYQALQSSISEKSAELATTMDMIDSINNERDTVIKDLQRQSEMFRNENVELQKEINKRKSAFDALAKRYQETKAWHEKYMTEADKVKAELAEQTRQLKSAEAKVATATKSLAALEERNIELEQSLKALTQPVRNRTTAPQSQVQPTPADTIEFPDVTLKP